MLLDDTDLSADDQVILSSASSLDVRNGGEWKAATLSIFSNERASIGGLKASAKQISLQAAGLSLSDSHLAATDTLYLSSKTQGSHPSNDQLSNTVLSSGGDLILLSSGDLSVRGSVIAADESLDLHASSYSQDTTSEIAARDGRITVRDSFRNDGQITAAEDGEGLHLGCGFFPARRGS